MVTLGIAVAVAISLIQQEAMASLETYPPVFSDYPSDARFITIQSPMIARLTMLFDRYTGATYQFVSKTEGGNAWQIVTKLANVLDSHQIDGAVNYMIYFSGLATKFTFLVNVRSGATWQLAEDTESGTLFWNPIYILQP